MHRKSTCCISTPVRAHQPRQYCLKTFQATQSAEPSTLVALERGGPWLQHVVLIGDHKQLPPTVLTKEFAETSQTKCWELTTGRTSLMDHSSNPYGNLARSLMERLIDEGRSGPVHMLTEQRRMHALIAKFSSEHFYEGKLKNWADDAKLTPVAPFTKNVEFVNVDGSEHRKGESAMNEEEAEKLIEVGRVGHE